MKFGTCFINALRLLQPSLLVWVLGHHLHFFLGMLELHRTFVFLSLKFLSCFFCASRGGQVVSLFLVYHSFVFGGVVVCRLLKLTLK